MIGQYLLGAVFLLFCSGLVAVAIAWVVTNPRVAILLSTITATAALKVWAVVAMGGFDLSFLLITALLAYLASALVVPRVRRIRARAA